MPRLGRSRFALLLPTGLLLAGLFGLTGVGSEPSCPAASASDAARVAVEPRSDNVLVADVTVVLNAADCPTALGAAELRTGRLPAALQRLQNHASGRVSVPLVLMDASAPGGRGGRWLTAFDPEGRLVWYYTIPERIRQAAANHPASGVVRLGNGNLLYQIRDFGVEEVSPDGRSVRVVEMDGSQIHHDLIQLEDGRVLFIGVEERVIDDTANGGPPIWRVWGDTLDVLDLDTREWKQAWSTFDAFDPFPRVPDRWRHLDRVEMDMPSIWEWTHANAIYFGRRGNLLLSFRHLDQVISLSPGFETVEWRLGGPDSSFTFPDPADQFYGQHTASELPNGNILLFDNGNFRPEGPYSRALELELDFGTMTARKVWEYRPQADVYAHRLSSATRLPNGNTLVNFGFRGDGPDQPPVIVEARPDGTAAWELTPRLPGVRTVSYRAYPWPTLGGELQVEPTGLTGLAAVGGR